MKIKEREHGDVGHFCHGGCAGYATGGQVPAMEKNDPSDIPEDIKEFMKDQQKAKRESRPDESWRITPPEKKESVAPYKRDQEDIEATMENRGAPAALPHYDEGGPVDFDPNQDLQDLAPTGSGMIAPSPSAPDPATAPEAPPVVAPPPAPPIVPAAAPAPMAKPAAPMATDQDFVNKANKMLGLGPDQQAAFMKLLGSNAQKGQIGAGIAGIGDAIASGGTLGKVNPGNLQRSEDLLQNKTKEGIEGMQTIRGNQEKAVEQADKLEARDPNSPLSKYAQKAYAGIGKKLGLDLSHASAALIGDVSGKGVDALNTEYQGQLKQMGLNLQKQTLDATIANQKAERAAAQATNVQGAAKALADKGAIKSLVDMIPGTAGHAANKVLERQATAGSAPSGPVPVNSKAEYEALPAGTHYVDSFGTEKVKK